MKPEIKNNHWRVRLAFALLIPCLAGCEGIKDNTLTGHLWDSDLGVNYHQPATHANVNLFQSADRKDVLVTYDEEYEKNGKITHRAFLLYRNEERIDSRMKPRFAVTNEAKNLERIPMVVGPQTNPTSPAETGLRAVLSEDGQRFRIISGGVTNGPYPLPVYLDGGSKALRIALTPATVTGDVAIYGTIAGIYWFAHGGGIPK